MPRIVLLTCLIALAAPLPASADGVIRFSGRVVEAPCDAVQSVPGEVVLSGCTSAVQGAVLTLAGFGGGEGARLVHKATGTAAGAIGMAVAHRAPDGHPISTEYRIEPRTPDASGAYLVSIDYL